MESKAATSHIKIQLIRLFRLSSSNIRSYIPPTHGEGVVWGWGLRPTKREVRVARGKQPQLNNPIMQPHVGTSVLSSSYNGLYLPLIQYYNILNNF